MLNICIEPDFKLNNSLPVIMILLQGQGIIFKHLKKQRLWNIRTLYKKRMEKWI